MKSYLKIVRKIIKEGVLKENRTGIQSVSLPGMMFRHDMSKGFPILTTKKVPFHLVASELEFFIRGITDKQWLQDRNNYIWDEWCRPDYVPYGHDEKTQKRMMEEKDLGPIYGWQWRHFGAKYIDKDFDYTGQGIDQLQNLINTLKTNPDDRRMIVTAWNPMDLGKMALPPCHHTFQVTVSNNKLNLMWIQRSVDSFLGLPFNITSYALLLHLLAFESGYEEGTLTGMLGDTHIYTNHLDKVETQLDREPYQLPTIRTKNFTSIFDWEYIDTEVLGYKHHPAIKAPIAI